LVEKDPDAYEVVLNEGSLDSVKVWQAGIPALAQYGSSITRDQIKLLMRLGVRSVILMYDNDKGGKAATRYSLGYHQHRVKGKNPDRPKQVTIEERYDPNTDLSRLFQVKIVDYGDLPVKDPGGMTARQIRSSIAGARPIL
jgi:5S rRNA maturation endonuclease (ribonuclease M5)